LKISNGDISATGHPIHFMFGSRVGFSGSADRMALFLVRLSGTDLIVLKSSNVGVEHKPPILPAFHDIGVLVQKPFQWLPVQHSDM